MVKSYCRRLATIILPALLVVGCGQPKQHDWSTIVTPTDPVISECRDKPAPKPALADRAHTGDDAARAYKKLDRHDTSVVKQLERCQLWAKGQR